MADVKDEPQDPSASADELDLPGGEDELEGEGQQRLIGIMYSERQWIVPEYMKVLFFFVAIALMGGLVGYSVDKRLTLFQLQMDAVVEPTPVRAVQAPDFSLPTGEGQGELKLADYKGKWVFINFWATWCPPCRDEMPSMEMLNRRFKDELVMIAITVDEDWNEVKRFFGDTPPSFHVAWDAGKRTATQYGTRKFPESFLIDPEGNVAAKFIGPRDWYNVGTVQYFEAVLKGRRDPA